MVTQIPALPKFPFRGIPSSQLAAGPLSLCIVSRAHSAGKCPGESSTNLHPHTWPPLQEAILPPSLPPTFSYGAHPSGKMAQTIKNVPPLLWLFSLSSLLPLPISTLCPHPHLCQSQPYLCASRCVSSPKSFLKPPVPMAALLPPSKEQTRHKPL